MLADLVVLGFGVKVFLGAVQSGRPRNAASNPATARTCVLAADRRPIPPAEPAPIRRARRPAQIRRSGPGGQLRRLDGALR